MSMKHIVGDYQAFFSLQLARLNDFQIAISGCEISHLAYRTRTYEEYLRKRDEIERHCTSNIENVWNGRPISIMQLEEPLALSAEFEACVIEGVTVNSSSLLTQLSDLRADIEEIEGREESYWKATFPVPDGADYAFQNYVYADGGAGISAKLCGSSTDEWF